MNHKILLLIIFLFIVACSTEKKDFKKRESKTTFIDSTDFKYFGLEKFDIQDWYDGKLNLKSLTKAQSKKYYQYRLRNISTDTNYYQFYSIQKNDEKQKIITIIDGATGNFPDLRMLIYDEKDNLVGFYPIAGIGTDSVLNVKYKVTSERINDTTYLSSQIKEYIGEFDLGKVSRDSIVTEFILELGYMKESKTKSKMKYKLE